MIVLPEMFATGFSMNVDRTAQGPKRETEKYLRELARRHSAVVLGGVVGSVSTSPSPEPSANSQATNEAVAFDSHGNELVRYRKMRPFTPAGEHLHYAAGNSHQIFAWNDMQVSPFVCYDLRFPEIFRPAALQGAELIVVVANWPATRSEHWVRLLQARAIENQAYVMGVNRCGADPKLQYDGRSVAFDPLGQLMHEANAEPQVLMIDVSTDVVRGWRAQFPALKDA
jgi:predicted amidohydrolase